VHDRAAAEDHPRGGARVDEVHAAGYRTDRRPRREPVFPVDGPGVARCEA
jgi:hypothetical protein